MSRIRRYSALPYFLFLERQLTLGSKVSSSIMDACSSQAGLAKLNIPASDLRPVSLNTLKAMADEQVDRGGWAALDALRRKLCESLSKVSERNGKMSSPSESSDVSSKNADVIVNEAHRARLRLESAYRELLQLANSEASRDEHFRNELIRHSSRWGEILGLALATKPAKR